MILINEGVNKVAQGVTICVHPCQSVLEHLIFRFLAQAFKGSLSSRQAVIRWSARVFKQSSSGL